MTDINIDGINFDAFDTDQKEVVLQLVKQNMTHVTDADSPANEFSDVTDRQYNLMKRDDDKVKKLTKIWKNNGEVDGLKERLTLEEMFSHDRQWHSEYQNEARDAGFTSTDHPLLINRVVSEVVKEAIEPQIVLTNLLQRISFSHGTQLTFPAMGAIAAADIPEGGEYPERSLEFAGQTVATIGKSGLAVKMTDEMIRYSLFDVMSMHLRAAGRALIRHKEQKVSDMMIDTAGGANTLFDNSSTSFLSTTGRDAGGSYNGTMTLDDIFKAYSIMANRGFTPNALIMNPFAWEIFADEGIARALGFQNGIAVWQAVQGSLGNAPQWSNGNFGNGLLQNTQVSQPQNVAGTFTNVPSVFPIPFNIIVSPFMPINTTTNRTDLIMCDISELGVLVVDEEVVTEEWDDPARDIRKVKLRERYAVAAINNGAATGVFKDISLSRSFDFARKLAPADVTIRADQPLSGDYTLDDGVGDV